MNYFGADDFAYTVAGSTGTSAPATVSIAVTAVNDLPVATAQALRTERDTPVALTLAGTDIEGTSLTFAISTPPQHGALTGTPPALTFTPEAAFVGQDSFSFTAHDGTDTSLPAAVVITVDAPDAGIGTDAGAPMADAGAEQPDAGTPADAGLEATDAGVEADGGVVATGDAGTGGADAGVEPMPQPSGCGCSTSPGALLAWSLGALLLRRRAR